MYSHRSVKSLFIMDNSLGLRYAWRFIILVLLALQTVDRSGGELSEEQREEAQKAYKRLMLERLFDQKSIPNKLPTNRPYTPDKKLKLPRAILDAYLQTREGAPVPDDRSFYGWINIDAYTPQENMWNVPRGDYDLEITLPTIHESFNSDNFRNEDARHMAHITLAHDPEEIPAHIEKILPPNNGMKFTSVHLRYNLTQGIYSSPTAATDFRLAKLYLNREKVNLCNLRRCLKMPMPFFKDYNQSRTGNADTDAYDLNNLFQYQHVYILAVNGYDKINDPITRVHTSKTIDITQTSTLEFDISDIVKEWLQDPKTNHGIIVRVSQKSAVKQSTIKRDTHSSLPNVPNSEIAPAGGNVIEHVRLRRAFQNYSDSLEVWLEKQPSLIIWSDPTPEDSPRHHVKRHHKEEDHQADEPDHTTSADQSTSTRLPTSTDETSQHTTQISPTGKSSSSTTTSGPHGKRDYIPTTMSSSSRRGTPGTRASSNSRPSSQQSGRPNKTRSRTSGKPMFCGVHSLLINFEEVGWAGWIIAPHSYYANYCSGDCSWPLSDAQNATNHAIIQSIYHSVGRRVPKSCCAPVKLGPMAILYQLDGIVQMKRYDDMIVEACGCL